MTQDIIIGTELKFNMLIQPIDNMHAIDFDFSVKAYGQSKTGGNPRAYILIQKDDCAQEDDDNYIVPVNTSTLSPGTLILELTAYIPDLTFIDGYRTEMIRHETDINLIR